MKYLSCESQRQRWNFCRVCVFLNPDDQVVKHWLHKWIGSSCSGVLLSNQYFTVKFAINLRQIGASWKALFSP